MFSWHDVRDDDLEECLQTSPRAIGHELVGWSRALTAWRSLLQSSSCIATAVEFSDRSAGCRIVAFGCSVFVSADFANGELADPKPGLASRLISSIDGGRSVVLTREQLRVQNSFGGLHMAILYSEFLDQGLTPEQTNDAMRQFATAAFQGCRGYRLLQLIREAPDAASIAHVRWQKQWDNASTFEEFHRKNPGNSWNRDRMLFRMNAENARSIHGSIYYFIFQYVAPVLRFNDTQQELLRAALTGFTDEDLARTLRIKLPTVKKRWASVFNRVEMVQPNLFPPEPSCNNIRGRQKRHYLLAYLRDHLEELRPLVPAGKSTIPKNYSLPAERSYG